MSHVRRARSAARLGGAARLGRAAGLAVILPAALLLAACSGSTSESSDAAPTLDTTESVVVYSGRSEDLVAPLLERFTTETGIPVEVRYGDTAELAIQILEEGTRSPADVYFGQDAGALGALEAQGRFAALPDDVLALVDPRYRSRDGRWTGVTGRSRNLVINTDLVDAVALPASVFGLVEPAWSGLVGWAPTNGSFQAFVTAMRLIEGEAATRAWLERTSRCQRRSDRDEVADRHEHRGSDEQRREAHAERDRPGRAHATPRLTRTRGRPRGA